MLRRDIYLYLGRSDLDASEALDNDIVSVIANDNHGEQGEGAENSPQSCIQLTA
jgi:hypothetical protein